MLSVRPYKSGRPVTHRNSRESISIVAFTTLLVW